jgi:hypothetical protein
MVFKNEIKISIRTPLDPLKGLRALVFPIRYSRQARKLNPIEVKYL